MKRVFPAKHSKKRVFAEVGGFFACRRCLGAFLFAFFTLINTSVYASAVNLREPIVRQQIVERLARESQQRKQSAWAIAKQQGWGPKGEFNSVLFELMAIDEDRVYVYKTCNVNAAISVATNLVRNTAPYNVNGIGLTVGIWDGGAVRTTHQEFGGRVSVKDGAANADHSTHVGGTIGAAGVVAAALGMAPSVSIDSYEWTDDLSEMTSRAMSYAGEPGTIQISNHSYGYICGWEYYYSPPRWYGTWGKSYRESDYFGQYDSETGQWDELCYNAPYYLPFKAVGNDRDDPAPANGATFQYYKWPTWRTKTYNSSTDPYSDGWDNGGFDTIMLGGAGKNTMMVGAVNDAVSGGVRDVNQATLTSFTCWGPTDDGRIKPDIVTNGTGLYSSIATSDSSYASYNGTSMATPGAAGSAMLLVDYFDRLFPDEAMRSSTIKALIFHTADDLGNAGPDYKFGWGLMNTKAAASQIKDLSNFPNANKIAEDILTADVNLITYTFKWDTGSAIKATLCWTDPPATGLSGLDNNSPRLINDLDLRIIDPNGSVYQPWVLNPYNPAAPATRGDNKLDNAEQVLISSPTVPGNYTVRVSHKRTLTNGQQYYSLVLSGQSPADFDGDTVVDFRDLKMLSDNWLTGEPSADIAPAGGDGVVNLLDFAELAKVWD